MAALRRYSIARQRHRSKLFSPERAIMAAFCVIAGSGVFMVTNGAGRKEPTALDRLASSQPLIKVPIASHITQTLDKIGDGLEGKTKPRRLSPAEVAAAVRQGQYRPYAGRDHYAESLARLHRGARQLPGLTGNSALTSAIAAASGRIP